MANSKGKQKAKVGRAEWEQLMELSTGGGSGSSETFYWQWDDGSNILWEENSHMITEDAP